MIKPGYLWLVNQVEDCCKKALFVHVLVAV